MLQRCATRRTWAALIIAFGLLAETAAGQELYVYPSKGQSSAQQEQDELACHKWAKSQSGVDMSAPAGGSEGGRRAGSMVGGAARGAAVGAAVGAIAGDAGKGAAAGGVVGGVAGRRRGIQREQQAQAQQQNAHQRAFAACMEARGYTVR